VAAQLDADVAAVLGLAVPVQAQPHQFGDPVLGVEYRAPTRLGGMRSDDRRHQRTGQGIGDRCRIQFGGVEFHICSGQAAVLWRLACCDMHGPSTFAMDVLGDVGEQREVRERPDDGNGPMNIDAVEHARQLGAIDLGASHPKRLDAGPFDGVEHLLTILVADRVAQDGAEQPDVFPHRLGRLATHLGAAHRTDRCQGDIVCHAPKYRRGLLPCPAGEAHAGD
jgi:hypothetical protein